MGKNSECLALFVYLISSKFINMQVYILYKKMKPYLNVFCKTVLYTLIPSKIIKVNKEKKERKVQSGAKCLCA